MVDEFTGALPRSQVDLFLDALIPTAADRAVASGDEAALRAALAEEPRHLEARLALGRTLLRRGAADDAVEVLKGAEHDAVGAGLLARAELVADPTADPEAAAAIATLDDDPEGAMERLIEVLTESPADRRTAYGGC